MRSTAVLLFLLLCGALGAQEQPQAKNRLYPALGLGFVNLEEKGLGINLPVGLQLILPRHRLVAAIQLLDLSLLQNQDRTDQRFVRTFVYGEPVCLDTQTRYLVSSFRCGGDTKAILSMGADLAFTPVETSFFGGKPGKLALGLGFRGFKPRTAYATVGLLFNSPNGGGNDLRLALGRHYVFLGAHWILLPKWLLGRH
ncbi:MAG: hypothetical protein IT369_02600 [Candidatus Latescibacteria bacterium]|nr:hypothetical protein [Candidatus Latescibacterota bacterium]